MIFYNVLPLRFYLSRDMKSKMTIFMLAPTPTFVEFARCHVSDRFHHLHNCCIYPALPQGRVSGASQRTTPDAVDSNISPRKYLPASASGARCQLTHVVAKVAHATLWPFVSPTFSFAALHPDFLPSSPVPRKYEPR